MKNVLFATTALVAMAGAAAAQEIAFSGAATVGYNDALEGGIFFDADLSAEATIDLGDSVTAVLGVKLFDYDDGVTAIDFDPTLEIIYDAGNYTASLKYGDLGDKGASEYFYVDRDGMAPDVENQDAIGGLNDIRALVEFGGFGVAVGCGGVADSVCDGLNVGAGATLGSIKLGIGYDDASGGQTAATAVSADATLGALSVGVSYATATTTYTAMTGIDVDDTDPLVGGADTTVTGVENSVGVELGYEISSALSVAAYYATNSVRDAQFGASVAYSSGALGIDAYFDVASDYTLTPAGVDLDGDGYYTALGTSAFAQNNSYGVDISYDVSEQLTAFAGVKITADTNYYAGIEYDVNDNISATVSYATADEVSGPDFKDGISVFLSAKF